MLGIVRYMRRLALSKQPYNEKKLLLRKQDGMKNSNVSKYPSPYKGTITSMTIIDRRKHVVFATADCFISFWDAKLSYLIGFVLAESPQVGGSMCLTFV